MKYPTLTYSGVAGAFKPIRSLITICGDSEVLVEQCKNIIECNEIKCTVSTHGYLIDIWGNELSLTSYSNGSAGICGRVESVSISRKGAKI